MSKPSIFSVFCHSPPWDQLQITITLPSDEGWQNEHLDNENPWELVSVIVVPPLEFYWDEIFKTSILKHHLVSSSGLYVLVVDWWLFLLSSSLYMLAGCFIYASSSWLRWLLELFFWFIYVGLAVFVYVFLLGFVNCSLIVFFLYLLFDLFFLCLFLLFVFSDISLLDFVGCSFSVFCSFICVCAHLCLCMPKGNQMMKWLNFNTSVSRDIFFFSILKKTFAHAYHSSFEKMVHKLNYSFRFLNLNIKVCLQT